MTKPIRIQRSRKKGWRMPENTVFVGRPSRWGNPFKVGDPIWGKETKEPRYTAKEAVRLYGEMMMPYRHRPPNNTLYELYLSSAMLDDIVSSLAGKNLACWCALDQPCHADWLLEVSNGK